MTTAFVLFAVVVAELLAVLIGAATTGLSWEAAADSFMIANTVLGVCCGACGVLIAANRPSNRLGWLLLGAGVCQTATAAVTPWFVRALHDGASEPVVRGLATVYSAAWPWSVSLFIPLALLFFPDGRLPGRRWRWMVPVVAVNAVVQVLVFNADDFPLATVGELDGVHRPANSYLKLDGVEPEGALDQISQLVLTATFVAALVALVVRYRRGDDRVRRQLLWLLLATSVAVALVAATRLTGPMDLSGFPVLALTAIALVPVSMTIAVVRHQLLDIRLLWLRTLTYTALTAVVVVAYLALVGVTDQVLRLQVGLGGSVLATLAVAAAFNPLRVWLQRGVERLLYGYRADPVRAAASVTAELAAGAQEPADVLPALCATLRLPYARLTEDGRTLGEHGSRPAIVEAIPLRHAGEPVGELEIGVRSGQRRLDDADRAVLDLLAVPIGVAMRADALTEQVRSSRAAIVVGREEERRRLRGDLHDGLGPVLTGIAFQADAVVNLAATDPDEVRQLGGEIRAAAGEAIADVRYLIHQLRPAALDEVGLVEAVRRQARRLDRRADGAPLSVAVSATTLPPLSAAVEVAAYRIVTESLTNAARHSTASRVEVVITCADGVVQLRVCDDGGGPVTPWVAGVGLRSLRDRAAELGGTFDAFPTATGGRISACLPTEVVA
jgi:two-component system NarL family sensor kinase